MSIGETLDRAHKAMGRAGLLVVTMIVRRRMRREYVVEAVEQLKFATQLLEALVADKQETD